MKPRYGLLLLVAWAACAACAGVSTTGTTVNPSSLPPGVTQSVNAGLSARVRDYSSSKTKIKHVVILVQENRTVDNLMNGYPGADTVTSGLYQPPGSGTPHPVPLQPMPIEATADPDHSHFTGFAQQYDYGKNDGWNNMQAMTYVPATETQPYWFIAQHWTFADHVLQSNQGPSLSAHQYLVAGQSGHPYGIAEMPASGNSRCGTAGTVAEIDFTTKYPGLEDQVLQPQICVDYQTIFDLLDKAKLSWRYYVPTTKLIPLEATYIAPYLINHLYNTKADFKRVVGPEVNILKDISNGKLTSVSYVIPRAQYSDHGNLTTKWGPYWVASVINAIGKSAYWNNTVVFVTWDDYGGWYDHYIRSGSKYPYGNLAVQDDPYEYAYRVPLLAASAYMANPGVVDHTDRDYAAILHFIESNWNLGSLNQLDAKTDNMMTLFNFSKAPATYAPIPIASGYPPPAVLKRLPPDDTPIDTQ